MPDQERSYHRTLIIFGITLLVFLGLFIHLIMIQFVKHWDYAWFAAMQRRSPLLTNYLRGNFYDRHRRIMRGTSEAWFVMLEKMALKRFVQIQSNLAPILNKDILPLYLKHCQQPYWIYPIPLAETQLKEIMNLQIPELKIISNFIREDHTPGLAWHLLGLWDQNHGFSGLEYLYQKVLRDRENSASVFSIYDAHKNYLPGLGVRADSLLPMEGVVLTIDRRIQQIVEQVMDQNKMIGAVVVLAVKTGEILAMTSRPMIDFRDIESSIHNQEHPFINRAIAAYHPGSIFKLVSLSAGLDSGLLEKDELFTDPGSYQIGNIKWLCTTSKGNGHGEIDLTHALAYSCNPVFIEIGLRLPPEIILEYADRFGLGQPCNVGLKDESWGNLPSGYGLYDGDRANMALGQQDVYTTPLQIASMVQTIANDGVRVTPRLVLGTINSEGRISHLKARSSQRVLKVETTNTLKQMMAAVIDYGTGKTGQILGGAAGKTGTAQVTDDPTLPPHAWFAGFAPLKTPQFVTVVFCEKGVSGGETAAPIFKEMMDRITKLTD